MKIVDCYWENANLQKRTCEISIEAQGNDIDIQELKVIEDNYDYIVIKADSGNVSIYQQLSSLGYYFVENQICIGFRTKEKNNLSKIAARYLEKLSLIECVDEEHIGRILSKIGGDLFYTDRIALDPHFSIEVANRRYSNWILNTVKDSDYRLFEIQLGGERVGFCYFKCSGFSTDYLLGGLYKDYQSSGFGILIPLSAISFADQNQIKQICTSISSNNIGVIRCYMECGYDILKMRYVFAKVRE